MLKKRCKIFLAGLLVCFMSLHGMAQEMQSNNALLDSAFKLAVWTIDHNIHDGMIEAGEGYGGEWTRDCAINCWNAVSLLHPEVAEKSLWSVTNDGETIGHQYWDKIIWTIGAYNHYQVTGDMLFLTKAYDCCKNTMAELEAQCFDSVSGLFMGPAVFQDGIAAYDKPVYDPAKWDDSYVLHHPNSATIKCLSTNVLYMESYWLLAKMSEKFGLTDASESYYESAHRLEDRIRDTFYRPEEHKFYYLIDHLGHPHDYQEGMGLAFALLFDLLDDEEAEEVVKNASITEHGIASVSPSFPRNTPDKPGRHNLMVWPHVNALYASGCAHYGLLEPFYFELENMADLAMNHSGGDFCEIYTIEGEPSGGYQCGALWDVKHHQTWCASGFIRLIINHIFGLEFSDWGIEFFNPVGMKDGSECRLSGLRYRNMNLTIVVKGHGEEMKSFKINGEKTHDEWLWASNYEGDVLVEIELE